MDLEKIGVTPQKQKQFNKKDINSLEDLSLFFPRKYIDCSELTGIKNNDFSVFTALFTGLRQYDGFFVAKGRTIGKDEWINVTWFRQPFLFKTIEAMLGKPVLVAGKPTWNDEYKNYSLSAPFLFVPNEKEYRRIYPVYSKIAGMSEDYLIEKIAETLFFPDLFPDAYPDTSYPSYHNALCEIHCPHTFSSLKKAEEKIAFNELSFFYEKVEERKKIKSEVSPFGIKNADLSVKIKNSLPYSLTEDQRGVLNSFYKKLKTGKRIDALVEGDVGTGKSIVAFLLMTMLGGNGYQSVLMAPTQVLARQHFEELSSLLAPFGEKVLYCGEGGLKKKDKEEVKSGNVKYIIGTHAVLNESIEFKNLALCITDEEHKFGVLQREALTQRLKNGVHTLSMSATPIPRSLAAILYGTGTELHTIKTKPAGRKPIITTHSESFSKVFPFLIEEIKKGRQAYVVCPAIEKNEKMEGVLSVEEISEIYRKHLPGIKIGTLTGKNKKDETEEIIRSFKENETKILIATTVIEVGVNVPNATLMIIQNAERFGLAGLHQLRGRVGRGDHQSYCILVSDDAENPRVQVMCDTTDGFRIAEEDLRLRGTGEILGLKQSGEDKYVTLMMKFPHVYEKIQDSANAKKVEIKPAS